MDTMSTTGVAEWPGLDGVVPVPEDLVQGIWRRGEYVQEGLRLRDGTPFRVAAPGRWNLTGGPDFRDARLDTTAGPRVGDVEVHFRASDWARHGHHVDPAYDRVILHVLLLPRPPGEPPARTSSGVEPEELVLLPRLLHDLEGYVRDEDTRRSAGRGGRLDPLAFADGDPAALRAALRAAGDARWRQKVAWASARVSSEGRDAACHQRLLECLGGPTFRGLGAALAWRHPWVGGLPPAVDPEAWLAEPGLPEARGPTRPANAPRTRLAQLAALHGAAPDWPSRAEAWCAALPEGDGPPEDLAAWRRRNALPSRRREAGAIFGGVVGQPRLDALVADVVLPLGAALVGRELGSWWWAWPAGVRPGRWQQAARLLSHAHPGGGWTHGWLTAAGELARGREPA